MNEKLSAKQERSNKMKMLYAENKIFNRLVLRKNEKGEWYFSTERLTDEEMEFIHKTWCGGC